MHNTFDSKSNITLITDVYFVESIIRIIFIFSIFLLDNMIVHFRVFTLYITIFKTILEKILVFFFLNV